MSMRDSFGYPVAILLGAAIGYLQIRLAEIALSALAVAAATMGLGLIFPRRPWRWALLVALCVPAALLIASAGRTHFTRGAIYGSFALLMPALACAYGGSFMRKLVRELTRK
jgi:hypothetical protein